MLVVSVPVELLLLAFGRLLATSVVVLRTGGAEVRRVGGAAVLVLRGGVLTATSVGVGLVTGRDWLLLVAAFVDG